MTHEIGQVTFGILTDNDIVDNSACLVDSTKRNGYNTVYNPRLGPLNTTDSCETCFKTSIQCPGHFGHIALVRHIFHPLFLLKLPGLLKKICFSCGTPTCKQCKSKQPTYKVVGHELLCNGISIDPNDFITKYPDFKRFVMSVLPVIPHCSRPNLQIGNVVADDDLTTHYIEIVKLNQKSPVDVKKIFNRISALMDKSKGKIIHTTTLRPLKGIKERLSGKSGPIRNNIMGKRVNSAGRTVIGSNPLLALDELEVPEVMAKTLTLPEICTDDNFKKLTHYLTSGQVSMVEKPNGKKFHVDGVRQCHKIRADPGDIVRRDGKKHFIHNHQFETIDGDVIRRRGEDINVTAHSHKITIGIGDVVHRCFQEGDYVVLNSQPSLHSASMQAMRIKIGCDKTLKFNLAITKSFNADFDGDEMNIYVPQTEEAQQEIRRLMVASNNIMSKQSDKPLIGIVQDACLGAYLMAKNDWYIDDETLNDIVMEIKFKHTKQDFNLFEKLSTVERIFKFQKVPFEKNTGKTLVSLILPNYFSIETDTVSIYNGVIYSGFIDKDSMNAIVKVLHNTFSNLHAADLIDNMQYITRVFLLRFGFTISLHDCKPPEKDTEAVEEHLGKAKTYTDENNIMVCLSNAKNKGQTITKNALDKDNHFFDTILSGSKGDLSNVTQIMGLLGQQNLKTGRPSDSLQHSHADGLEARGFIRSNFIQGLNPREFWYHAMSGREGVCDTSVNTSTSGYIQRKLVKNVRGCCSSRRWDGS